jgi:hypothetical protein
MATLANPTTIPHAAKVNRRSISRSVFRWIHIVFAIPIVSYIYSPFERLPDYAFQARYIFVPGIVLSGLWLWKGHVVRRLFSKWEA